MPTDVRTFIALPTSFEAKGADKDELVWDFVYSPSFIRIQASNNLLSIHVAASKGSHSFVLCGKLRNFSSSGKQDKNLVNDLQTRFQLTNEGDRCLSCHQHNQVIGWQETPGSTITTSFHTAYHWFCSLDVLHAGHQCSKFAQKQNLVSHEKAVKCNIRYLKRTPKKGIILYLITQGIQCRVDADFSSK